MPISIEMGALSKNGRCRLKFDRRVRHICRLLAAGGGSRARTGDVSHGLRDTSWMEELQRPATIRAVVATEPRRERVIGLFVTPKAMGGGENGGEH